MAEHVKLQCYRAIKRIPKDNHFYEQLMNEAKILKNLKHPNIPIIYDIEEDDNYSYIIEEFLEGQSLKAFRLCQSNIQEELIINFAIQICDLFQYIHAMEAPILYLDLKPDNIVVQDNTLKLVDFGAAIYREESEKRKVSLGTKGYAAPEQYKLGSLDERSDIYGIGVLLYFLVSQNIYSQDLNTQPKLDETKSCSRKLSAIIFKCLKYSPTQRFQSVTQLRKKLLTLQQTRQSESIVKSKPPLVMAIVGAQSRIGTTHISFLVTSYINQFIESAIYVEKNEHRVVGDITNRYLSQGIKKEICYINKCPILLRSVEESKQLLKRYRISVYDYGVLSRENIEEYGQADIKLFVLGTKEWELSYAEQGLKELIPYEEIYYLFNFMDGRRFLEAAHNMKKEHCIRVPYYPEPFFVKEQGLIKEFIEEFFQEKGNEKKVSSIKKNLWLKRTKK